MKMINHQTPRRGRHLPGFASLLTVTSVGLGLLIILISMYKNTVESHSVQKNTLLKNDYQQREEAFLRALTNIVPNKAMLCMQDGSAESTVRADLNWAAIFREALAQSNSEASVSPAIAQALGIDDKRNGNAANTLLNTDTVVTPLMGVGVDYDNKVTSGTNMVASSSFPPPLECSGLHKTLDSRYPIVGYAKKYGSSATGWVQASVDDHPHYNLVKAPKIHFSYTGSETMIAKHNWWGFELSFAGQDKDKTKLTTRKKKYIISLYEIPSQLPISASTYTTFGAHSDGTEWSNVTMDGGVFAEKVKTEGSFSSQSISSRQGVQLSSNTTVNGSVTGGDVGSNPFASDAREIAQSNGHVFPISSASDGGRVSFIPINRGLEFYDRYHGTGHSPNSTNAVSPTSWDYYSIGAKQCRMRLDVTDVASVSDQTPRQIRFTYWKDIPDDGAAGTMVTETFTKGSNWPDDGTQEAKTFPFHVDNSASGRPCIAIYMERLASWLTARNAGHFDINRSLSVNVDYVNNASIVKPPFPSAGGDLSVILLNARDLTTYSSGFSLVTNMQLIFADDVNITPTTPPAGVTVPEGRDYYPPLSFFSPEKRYGDSAVALKIEIDGQLGSLAKGNSEPIRIADLKSGVSDLIVPENISAELRTISHPAALPPINMMNWMVVVREIHPHYTP